MKQTMSRYFNAARQFVQNRKMTFLAILIVLLGAGYVTYAYTRPAAPSRYVLALAQKGTIVASLTGTGQVLAENQLDIKPISSGTVVSINVTNGQSVSEGQVIAELDQRAASVSLAEARASLESAQANLSKVQAGAASVSVESSQLSIDNSRQDLMTKIKGTFTQADNLIRTSIDAMYKDPNSYITPQFQLSFYDTASNIPVILTIPDISQSLLLGSDRQHMTTVLAGLQAQADSLTSTSTDADVQASAQKSEAYIGEMQSFLSDVGNGVNSLYFNTSKYKSTIDGYKTTVASARSTADSLYSDLVASDHALASAKSQLVVLQAPARPEDITTAQAQVDSAKASLQSAQNAYSNNIVTAPFNGIIAGMTIHKGDAVGGSTAVATLVTKAKVAQIPLNEVDAAKVKVGQKATLTFDALPDLSVAGTVAEIDPLGTVTQGVVTYNIKVSFDTQDDRVKPNMSVSAAIVTGLGQDVLLVPNSAVKTKGAVAYVSVAEGVSAATTGTDGTLLAAAPVDTAVTTGLSNDTETEITGGINEGSAVVTKVVAGTAVKPTASAGSSGLSLLGGGGARGGAAGGGTRGAGAALGR